MGKNEKILLVDEELDFVESLRMTLKAKSYQVITATSRAQAQEKVKAEEPDAVILGTIMPQGEPFSLHNWLKRHPRYKDLPLLVIDAPPEKQLIKGWRRHEGMRMEADDYVAKPIEPAMLVPRIQRLLDEVTKRIKVLVADDHSVVRDGIRSVLSLQRDMEVVGEARDGKEAVEKVPQLLPNVVLMDIVMPAMDGLKATKQISRECPQVKILILTQYDDEENVLASRRSGACGFISKRAASAQLVDGIRSVYEKGSFSPSSG